MARASGAPTAEGIRRVKASKPAGDRTSTTWVEPQLCKLVEKAPSGSDWIHEIKFGRLSDSRPNCRRACHFADPIGPGLDGQISFNRCRPEKAEGQLRLYRWRALWGCARRHPVVRADAGGDRRNCQGTSHLLRLRSPFHRRRGDRLYAADRAQGTPAEILAKPPKGIEFSAHFTEDGETIRKNACAHGLEGIVSTRAGRAYLQGTRHLDKEQILRSARLGPNHHSRRAAQERGLRTWYRYRFLLTRSTHFRG